MEKPKLLSDEEIGNRPITDEEMSEYYSSDEVRRSWQRDADIKWFVEWLKSKRDWDTDPEGTPSHLIEVVVDWTDIEALQKMVENPSKKEENNGDNRELWNC